MEPVCPLEWVDNGYYNKESKEETLADCFSKEVYLFIKQWPFFKEKRFEKLT